MRAEAALAALAEHPERLDRERLRFSDSPPSYTSHQSHNSTLSNSPNVYPENLMRDEMQEERDRYASTARGQMDAQQIEETKRIIRRLEDGTHRLPQGVPYDEHAFNIVRSRWERQGIWRKRWKDEFGIDRWRHEEPLDLSSMSVSESDGQPDAGYGPSVLLRPTDTKPKQPRILTDEEFAKRMSYHNRLRRDREASRPFHQFLWQLSKERECIHEGGMFDTIADSNDSAPLDINTQAYNNVKSTWVNRGIWDKEWGIIPGMSWKHERPKGLRTLSEPSPAPNSAQTDFVGGVNGGAKVARPGFKDTSPAHANSFAATNARAGAESRVSEDMNAFQSFTGPHISARRPLFGDPFPTHLDPFADTNGRGTGIRSVFGHRNEEGLSGHQARDALDDHPISDGDVPRPEASGDDEMPDMIINNLRSPSSKPSPRSSVEIQIQKPRRGRPKTTSSRKPSQAPIEKSLGPIDPSRVSESRDKKTRGPGRPKIAQDRASNSQETIQALNTAANPVLRRSKRIQQTDNIRDAGYSPEPSKIRNQTDQKKARGSGTRTPKASAKPQGIMKRKRLKKTT